MPDLLSRNDRNALRSAMAQGREIVLEREMGGFRMRASTVAARPVWGVGMLVRLEEWSGGLYSSQYLTGIDDLERTLRGRYGGGIR